MKQVEKLSYDLFNDTTALVSLGKLSPKMIEFISSKVPHLKNVLSTSNDILFWKDRIEHTKRHQNDFISDNEFENCFENIPNIIKSPDYISYSKKDNSISFIKIYSSNTSVAIRISSDGKMAYRTMYPIMSATLDNFLRKNTAWKYPD